jgi:hypothetical protein
MRRFPVAIVFIKIVSRRSRSFAIAAQESSHVAFGVRLRNGWSVEAI